jgi:amino acid adenylation domain-containing protein
MTPSPDPTPIERLSARTWYPLSPSQRGAWMREQIHPGNLFYNVFRTLRFTGPLDVERLRQALQAIVDRHDILRATFTTRDGVPVQSFGPLALDLAVEDLAPLAAAAGEEAIVRRIREVVRVPFDLAAGPLCRFTLFRTAGTEHRLVVALHHIVIDGVSILRAVTEVMAVYSGRQVPPPPIQYQDFAAWQHERLESGDLEPAGRYWLERLAGPLPVLDLPADRPRPAAPSYEGASCVRRIGPGLTAALKALRRERSTTLFRTLLAAFKVLLHRMTGETDVVVGSPLSGRTHPQVKDLIGFFVNTPALRTDLSGDPTFLEALSRVHETAAGAVAHQDYPFAHVIEMLNPDRDLSRLPLYSVVFTQEPVAPPRQVGPLLLSQDESVLDVAPFDLTVTETEMEDGIRVVYKYSRDLFDPPTIERLAACFERLLESLVATPEARISELEILPEAERERLLVDFNRTGEGRGGERPFSAVFAQRVAAQPAAVAAVCGGEQVSYAGLAARAAAVAGWLRARGAGPEARVGVFGERGIGMLATIAGILEAGAAWVPLDPAHPDARLAAILAGSGVGFVATQARLAARARELTGGLAPAVLCWDEPPGGRPGAAAAGDAGGHALANVFYTSGSTGVPKGAMVERAGMLNHLWAKIALLDLGPDSVVVQNAAHGFDISVWQMLAPLLVGGRTLIVDDGTAADPGLLLAALERGGATVLETVPTLLETLLEAAGEEVRLPALAHLISNAETLPVGLCRRWLERFPGVPLINTYGATECSDDTTHQLFRTPPPAAAPRVGVGRPIPGLRIYVVDRHLRPVPLGCPGQIAMAGVGVGRGYLGAPEKTAAVFAPDPFGPAGERLYLSGDLGRWTEAGDLDLLGRLDSQLKVRGYRIELGEVEAALARHPAVRQGVVVARPDGRGGQRLIAYLVADGEPAAAELHGFLAQALPRPMLPERFVQLAALPLNRNGKVDRQALPDPPAAPEREGYVAPRTGLEAAIAGLWQSVLGSERVGVHDDFFELGGHSLKAIQLATQMKLRLGAELSVRDLFLTPTVAGLAAAAEKSGGARLDRPAIPRGPDRPHYPLSLAQSVQWFAAQVMESEVEKPAEILKLAGPLDRRALGSALRRLVDRHEALRTAFLEVAGEPAQTIQETVAVDCPELDLSALGEAAREDQVRLLLREAARPFDLGRPPLLRARLLRLAAESHLLLLNLPHIVSDGWSEQLLLRELAGGYNAFRAGRGAPLSRLPLRLVDAAAWQHEQLATPALAAQRELWLARFRDGAPPLAFPEEGPLPAAPAAAAVATLACSPELSLAVKRLASASGATLFMVLMAAFKALLARWTGQTDLVVGSVLAGRSHPDLEGLVGVFINTLALRSDQSGNPAFSTVLDRVRRTTLEAIANQDYPFHAWLEVLRRERRQSDYLPFSALFVLHQRPALAAFDGLAVRYVLHHEVTGEILVPGTGESWSASGQMLRLDAIESDDSLQLMLSSGSGRPPGATLERLLGQLRSILEQVTQAPGMLLAELRLGDGEARLPAFATVELAASDLEELFGAAAGAGGGPR